MVISDTDADCGWTMNPDMVLVSRHALISQWPQVGSGDHSDQHAPSNSMALKRQHIPTVFNGNRSLRYQCRPWAVVGSRTKAWPQLLLRPIGHHGLEWYPLSLTSVWAWLRHSLQTPTWSQEAAQIVGIFMAFDGHTGHKHQYRLRLWKDHKPRHGPWQYPRHGCHCGLAVMAGHPYWHGPSGSLALEY